MKYLYLSLMIMLTPVIGTAQDAVDLNKVLTEFNDRVSAIEKIAYDAHRIDTFASGHVWNNRGYALIEKNVEDSVFGFSFYGKREDVSSEEIYDKGVAFRILEDSNSFRTSYAGPGFLGTPGGQMVVPQVFELYDHYKFAEVSETEQRYVIRYELEDDITHDISNRVNIVELDKESFLPVKIIEYSSVLGNKVVYQMELSNIRLNDQVNGSIADRKNKLQSFRFIPPKQRDESKLLNTAFPPISLPNLLNQEDVLNLVTDKVTLIDIWEVWCAPCIRSLPEVEKLKNKYSGALQVVGIVSEDKVNAIKLINKKEITFLNLAGNQEIKQKLNINQIPTYFLVDKHGVVRGEYFGFDGKKIEDGIRDLIK